MFIINLLQKVNFRKHWKHDIQVPHNLSDGQKIRSQSRN